MDATSDIWDANQYLHFGNGRLRPALDLLATWAAGTSLRPYLEALPVAPRAAFREAYSAAMRQTYPQRENGVTLLPFKRLFIITNV